MTIIEIAQVVVDRKQAHLLRYRAESAKVVQEAPSAWQSESDGEIECGRAGKE